MGNLGLGVILVGAFIIGFMFSWSIRHAFNIMVWFGVGWMGSLFILWALDLSGYGFISTDPLGPVGAIGIGIGALVAYFYHRRWQKAEAERQRIKAAEAAARRARGEREPTLIGNVARVIGRMRSSSDG